MNRLMNRVNADEHNVQIKRDTIRTPEMTKRVSDGARQTRVAELLYDSPQLESDEHEDQSVKHKDQVGPYIHSLNSTLEVQQLLPPARQEKPASHNSQDTRNVKLLGKVVEAIRRDESQNDLGARIVRSRRWIW